MVIYKITNKINGKIYIGQTVQKLSRRWSRHKYDSKKLKLPLSRAIQKYGKENFIIEEIDGANSLSELNYLETHYIYKYESLIGQKGYNVLFGGNNSLLDKETKNKISKSVKRKFNSKKYKNKFSKINQKIAEKRYSRKFNVYKAVMVSKRTFNTGARYKKGNIIGTWNLKKKCAQDLNIYWTGVSQALNGTIQQYKNYIFEYCGEAHG